MMRGVNMIYRFVKTRRQRVVDFLLLVVPWRITFKIFGVILICVAVEQHFNIHFTYFEALCLGVGLGFLID